MLSPANVDSSFAGFSVPLVPGSSLGDEIETGVAAAEAEDVGAEDDGLQECSDGATVSFMTVAIPPVIASSSFPLSLLGESFGNLALDSSFTDAGTGEVSF